VPAADALANGASPGHATAEAVVRVPLGRLAEQLPRALAHADLTGRELLLPYALIVPQLAEGIIRVPLSALAGQLGPAALSAGGDVVLPLDEIVRQLPPDVFQLAAPPPELSAIEAFPAPFRPTTPSNVEAEAAVSLATPAPMSDVVAPATPDVAAPEPDVAAPEPVVGVPEPVVGMPDELPPVLDTFEAMVVDARASELPAATSAEDQAAEADEVVTTLLDSLDGLPWMATAVRSVGGRAVVALARSQPEELAAAGARVGDAFEPIAGLPPVTQVTLRNGAAATVVTAAGGALLVVEARRGRGLANVELTTLSAARRVQAEPRPVPEGRKVSLTPAPAPRGVAHVARMARIPCDVVTASFTAADARRIDVVAPATVEPPAVANLAARLAPPGATTATVVARVGAWRLWVLPIASGGTLAVLTGGRLVAHDAERLAAAVDEAPACR
jgi:hypothetical protein